MKIFTKIRENPYTGTVKRIILSILLFFSVVEMVAFVPKILARDFVLTKIASQMNYLCVTFVIISLYLAFDFIQNYEKSAFSPSFSLLFSRGVVQFFRIFLNFFLTKIPDNGLVFIGIATLIFVCEILCFVFISLFFAFGLTEFFCRSNPDELENDLNEIDDGLSDEPKNSQKTYVRLTNTNRTNRKRTKNK